MTIPVSTTSAASSTAETTSPQETTAPQQIPTSGKCGQSVTWEIVGGERLVISGNGKMYSYSAIGAAPWYVSKDRITRLEIGSGITHIGNYSFAGMDMLVSASMTYDVLSLGAYAFYGDSKLSQLNLPSSIAYAGEGCVDGTEWYRKECADSDSFVITIGCCAYKYTGTAWENSIAEIIFGTRVSAFMPYAIDASALNFTVRLITFPTSDISIYSKAFCNLEHTTIEFRPYSGTVSEMPAYIAPDAFYNCSDITVKSYENPEIRAWAESRGFTYIPY